MLYGSSRLQRRCARDYLPEYNRLDRASHSDRQRHPLMKDRDLGIRVLLSGHCYRCWEVIGAATTIACRHRSIPLIVHYRTARLVDR